jgi:tetratricopeptide (TPR) repeat protein
MKIARLFEKRGDVGNALKYLNFLHDKALKSAEIERRLKGIVDSKSPKSMEYVLKFSSYLDQDSRYSVDIARYLITNGRKLEGMSLLRRTLRGSAKGDASLYMAEVLINEKKYTEARRFISPIMLDGRYFSGATYLMAIILRQEGDNQQAIQSLLKSIKFTKDYRIRALLADIYWDTGDRTNALKYYIMASNAGDSISSVKAGDLYYLSGDRARSLSYYKRALDLGIDNPESAQWTYYQYGKLSKNKEYLKKAVGSGGIIGEAAKIIISGEE